MLIHKEVLRIINERDFHDLINRDIVWMLQICRYLGGKKWVFELVLNFSFLNFDLSLVIYRSLRKNNRSCADEIYGIRQLSNIKENQNLDEYLNHKLCRHLIIWNKAGRRWGENLSLLSSLMILEWSSG